MFKSFKTVVVTLTMLAVGYGAHVVFNGPLPSNDNSHANREGWNTPNLVLRDGQILRPDISLDGVQAAPHSSSPQIVVPVPAPGPAPAGGSAMNPSGASGPLTVPPPVPSATTHQGHDQGFPELLPLTSKAGSPPLMASPPSTDLASQGLSPAPVATATTHTPSAVADYGSEQGTQPTSAAPLGNVNLAAGNSTDANVRNVSAVGSDTSLSSVVGIEEPFEAIWNSAQAKLANRDYAQALFTFSLAYGDPLLTSQQQDQILPLLDRLAGTVIYSRENHLLQPHTVQPGETASQIAGRYGIPPEFLARVNGLRLDVPLQPGQTLKVVQGPFRGQLNLTRRELTLFLNRYYAGRFVVSVGRDAPAQDMMLQVGEKSGPRPYQDPATGQQIPPSDPSNPYGSHWIGLQAPNTTATNLAIHSSGAQLDASDTRGCFSVSSKDAADLMAILSVGSRVSVVR